MAATLAVAVWQVVPGQQTAPPAQEAPLAVHATHNPEAPQVARFVQQSEFVVHAPPGAMQQVIPGPSQERFPEEQHPGSSSPQPEPRVLQAEHVPLAH